MSSITKIRKQIDEQHQFAEQCADRVKESRIIVRVDNTSYINRVGVYVTTLLRELDKGLTYADLIDMYPGLTQEDIEACLLFVVARGKLKL